MFTGHLARRPAFYSSFDLATKRGMDTPGPKSSQTTRTGMSIQTASGSAPTMLLMSRTPGAPSRATTARTYGMALSAAGVIGWRATVKVYTEPVPGRSTHPNSVDLHSQQNCEGGWRNAPHR